ncbi:TetR/AcrR family transcriptional regulator [Streptosporangium sp. NBC_01495]|uniref:TetR/AcrR family transcriptional regulator n=1 Tax=Streptosporangium sp. NBC_01495 TaxID=2903899 RepID=UPI002E2F353A|nr:TetR/AcrR family transcriptional regulator [Streptosporangium sp. NBC_01495]
MPEKRPATGQPADDRPATARRTGRRATGQRAVDQATDDQADGSQAATTRRPVKRQARGLRRMEEILDAAEGVIAEAGYADMTTNAVAERAGMSPGSLYQFFRNKEEILDGLLDRFTEGRSAHWAARLTGDVVRMPAADLIDQVVDEIVAYKASRPAYWALLHGSATGDRLATASERLHRDIARRIAEVLSVRAPRLGEERRLLIATMMLATIRAVLPLVAAGPPERAAELTAELKTLLTGYLSTSTDSGQEPGA